MRVTPKIAERALMMESEWEIEFPSQSFCQKRIFSCKVLGVCTVKQSTNRIRNDWGFDRRGIVPVNALVGAVHENAASTKGSCLDMSKCQLCNQGIMLWWLDGVKNN